MAEMQKILSGIRVDKLVDELKEHPELWDAYDFRTNYPGSAHADVSDIVLRYRDFSDFDVDNPKDFSSKHESQWYAAAFHMPQIKKTIEDIFSIVSGDELGGCLITKIPAGKSVLPHSDAGYWHSEHYLNKYLLLLESAPKQTFEFGDEVHEGEAGDLFIFDNRSTHAVYNKSDVDRISLILAVRQKVHNE
jgi:hypothetical protein